MKVCHALPVSVLPACVQEFGRRFAVSVQACRRGGSGRVIWLLQVHSHPRQSFPVSGDHRGHCGCCVVAVNEPVHCQSRVSARSRHRASVREREEVVVGMRSLGSIPRTVGRSRDGSSRLRSPSKLRARWGLIAIEPTPLPGSPSP